MRILLASPYDLTHAGGVTSHVFDLAHEFHNMGHEVLVTGPDGDGLIPQNGFTRHIGSSFSVLTPGDSARVNLNPLIASRVRALLAERQFDVYHIHEPFLGFIGASFLRYGRGVKVGTFHSWREGPHIPYIAFWPLVNYWNRRLDGRIAVSETARQTINRYVAGDYRIIPNAICFQTFARRVPPPRHLDDEQPTVLFVGRLVQRKGISYLLRAFCELKKRIPHARLVIAGDGTLRSALEDETRTLGLQDVLFEGAVPREELPAYYQRADVFCSPSTANESFGITLLEAMAAGTPVVSTSINAPFTLGADGTTGVIVPPRDAPALANAIENVLTNRPHAACLAQAARERAMQFDWSVITRRLLDYYEECGA